MQCLSVIKVGIAVVIADFIDMKLNLKHLFNLINHNDTVTLGPNRLSHL